MRVAWKFGEEEFRAAVEDVTCKTALERKLFGYSRSGRPDQLVARAQFRSVLDLPQTKEIPQCLGSPGVPTYT